MVSGMASEMASEKFDADVLIVGAGPVGLALATELTLRGHTVRIVERNDRTGVQPRAKTTNIRTMAQMRRWGLAPEMRRRSPLAAGFPRDVTFRTALFDAPLYTFHDAFCASPRRYADFPEHAEFIPQYVVEGILADHVAAQPRATLSMGCALLDFEQDAAGVTARLRNAGDGAEERVRTRWLVGADGGRSLVRETLGIAMQGQRNMLACATLILRIPGLYDDPELTHGLFHWIINPEAASFIGPLDRGDLWYWSKVAGRDVPTEELLETARKSIGRDYPLEVVARDDWLVHSLIAERYREGRVFLAGDACHLHSPFGGHGMNLGIGDAVDLGWKLSAALEGWGGDGLLDSYTVERQQAHRAVVASATENVASLSDHFADPDLTAEGPAGDVARARTAEAIERLKTPEFRSVGLVLGNAYAVSPAIAAEPDPAPPIDVTAYRPSARPGCLAPHVWLDETTSLYDRFGPGFTLLRLAGAQEAREQALATAAASRGAPLTIAAIDHDGLRDLYEADYALIRPDQHVGWRGDALPEPEFLLSVMQGNGAASKQATVRQTA